MGKTFADDSLTGLHLGFGLNVVADEYKSDVDVLGIAKYASGGKKWTFTGPRFNGISFTNDTELKYIGNNTVDQFYNKIYFYNMNGVIKVKLTESTNLNSSEVNRKLKISVLDMSDFAYLRPSGENNKYAASSSRYSCIRRQFNRCICR